MNRSEVNFYWEKPIDPLKIKEAWEMAFCRKISNELWFKYWDWLFKNNPFSDNVLASYIAVDDEIASFVAFSPIMITYCDIFYNAALGNNGFTNPKYLGMGYYSLIYSALIDQMRNLGYHILFGFDNHNSHYPEVKYLGWKNLGLLTEFSLLSTKIKQKINYNSKYKVIFEELSEDIIKKLSNMEVSKEKFSFQRNYEFLKWRIVANPVNHYFTCNCYFADTLLASAVLKSYQECEIDVMEIFYNNDYFQEYNIILNAIISFILGKGFKKINIWSNLHSNEHLMLEKIGFVECQFSSYLVYYPINMYFNNIDFKDLHYRFIDSDVY